MQSTLLLGACRADESLAQSPHLPADLFTACLVSPIQIALRWAITQSPLFVRADPSIVEYIPGDVEDRSTPLGELVRRMSCLGYILGGILPCSVHYHFLINKSNSGEKRMCIYYIIIIFYFILFYFITFIDVSVYRTTYSQP